MALPEEPGARSELWTTPIRLVPVLYSDLYGRHAKNGLATYKKI
jgi:hypothetical protein